MYMFSSAENRWKGDWCSAEASCVRACVEIHGPASLHTRRWSFLSSGCVLCVCESAAGQHHHWRSDKSLISRLLLLVLDIAGRSNDRGSTGSLRDLTLEVVRFIWVQSHQHICYRWLVRTCACVCVCAMPVHALTFFCVGVSAFVREGRREEKEWGEKELQRVWGWYMRFFLSEKKTTTKKQQEMKFAAMSLCHPPRFSAGSLRTVTA